MAAVPHLAQVDQVVENDVAPLTVGTLGKASFRYVVGDFYLTNPIARASEVMAELSAQARGRAADKLAAE